MGMETGGEFEEMESGEGRRGVQIGNPLSIVVGNPRVLNSLWCVPSFEEGDIESHDVFPSVHCTIVASRIGVPRGAQATICHHTNRSCLGTLSSCVHVFQLSSCCGGGVGAGELFPWMHG